ncbi:unnamed protein product [Rhizoctonia solani]|nr:unnamed protein product [Rhizoctonia solani]
MSAPPDTNPLAPNKIGLPVEESLEDYVKTARFDQECSAKARAYASSSNESSDSSDNESICSSSTNEYTTTTVETDPHKPSRTEAHLYYAGLRSKGRGPKLVYRDSSDVYEEPSGPEEYKRLMRLVAVPDNHEFGKNGLWDRVRDKVVELLDAKNIELTCVDFIRFTWLNKKKDQEIEEDEEEDEENNGDEEDLDYHAMAPIMPVEDGDRYTTNPTIWVGVAPDTLTAAVAFEVTKDIRAFLDGLNVTNIDIAYRETLPKSSPGHGPALFPTIEDGEPLKEVIDNVSIALSLPISGLKTTMQGTMGPYFHVGNRLLAVTARHNVFHPEASNAEYRYNASRPKKDVVLMGNPAFTNYLVSIQAHIGTLLETVESIDRKINTLTIRVRDGVNIPESQIKLDENVAELGKIHRKIDVFKAFYVDIKKGWSKIKQRVIGYVVWAPPIGVGVAPYQYTRDLCVVELYKDRFMHLIGNVLSLGPEYTSFKLKGLLHECNNVPSGFKYPEDGLLRLQGILTAEQVKNPETKNLQGNPFRRVLKRGFTTNTTVGTVTRYMSFVRKYFPTGNLGSIELPIIPHENETGTFSKGGDSGSTIVSPHGEFVSLLTGGTNKGTGGSDITYSTMFEWVWELVLAEFPDANLYFENMAAFLAAPV